MFIHCLFFLCAKACVLTVVATGMWLLAGKVEASQYEFKVTKLFTGNEYNIRVFAENGVGLSDACELQQPITARLPYGE